MADDGASAILGAGGAVSTPDVTAPAVAVPDATKPPKQSVYWGIEPGSPMLGGGENRGPSSTIYSGKDILRTTGWAKSYYNQLSMSERARLVAAAQRLGIKPSDSNLRRLWNQAVTDSAGAYSDPDASNKWTPFDVLALRASYQNSDGLGDIVTPKDRKQVQVNLVNKGQAQTDANQYYQQTLGRDATAAEAAAYMGRYNAEAQANPSVTVTKSTPEDDGTFTETSTTSGGADGTNVLDGIVQGTGEKMTHDAETTYMNAFINAIRSPVGGV
jgi:hypothetical protein